MSIIAVIGLQWGDEGKGKLTDVLASQADLVVRFQGGANAGHTLVVGDNVIRSHLIPSGILYKKTMSIIGPGCVFDPEIFKKELETLKDLNVPLGKIMISDKANVVFPYHKLLDGLGEERLGKDAIGTTRMGIGPCYSDKVNRLGIRVSDLVSGKNLKELLKKNLDEKNFLITNKFEKPPITIEAMLAWAEEYGRLIKDFVCNAEEIVNDYASGKKRILFEGAQGTLLDVEWGNYPFVTSSNTVSGNIYIGGGLSPKHKVKVIGVVKAYSTRVGNGPLPGELLDETGDWIRKKGNEFGATTGRPRRVGWLNLDLLKYSIMINGVSSIAMTKLDVLSGLKKIGISTGSEEKPEFSGDIMETPTDKLKIKYFKGWDIELENITNYKDLPVNSRSYLKFIQKSLKTKISIISLGAQRSKYILMEEIWK